MIIPILQGSLRTTTPEMKKNLNTRKHFNDSITNQKENQLKYINQQNIIQCIKTKKHISPIQSAIQCKSRRSLSPMTSQLQVNLIPKLDDNQSKSPLKSKILNSSCTFENICLTTCRQCEQNSKLTYYSPIKLTQSILTTNSLTSRGNYYKK